MKQRSPLAPIFLIVLVDVLALTIMIPLLPFYTEAFGGAHAGRIEAVGHYGCGR